MQLSVLLQLLLLPFLLQSTIAVPTKGTDLGKTVLKAASQAARPKPPPRANSIASIPKTDKPKPPQRANSIIPPVIAKLPPSTPNINALIDKDGRYGPHTLHFGKDGYSNSQQRKDAIGKMGEAPLGPDGRKLSKEEHPPAMTKEGGKSATTGFVPLKEQHIQGGVYSAALKKAKKTGTDQVIFATPKKQEEMTMEDAKKKMKEMAEQMKGLNIDEALKKKGQNGKPKRRRYIFRRGVGLVAVLSA